MTHSSPNILAGITFQRTKCGTNCPDSRIHPAPTKKRQSSRRESLGKNVLSSRIFFKEYRSVTCSKQVTASALNKLEFPVRSVSIFTDNSSEGIAFGAN